MVRINLLIKPKDYEGVSFFKDAYNDKDIDNIHIFSLNHDIVIEEIFKNNNEYTNGFGKEINEVKYWDRNLFSMQYKVKLYKLHGSISWFYFIPNKKNNDILFGDIGSKSDFYHSKDPDGEFQWPMGNPQMLIGTDNKIFSYVADRVFSELYFWFQYVLRSVKYLFILGYGFNDFGINNRLRIFYQVCKDIKIIVVDLKDYKEKISSILGNTKYKNNLVYFIKGNISNIKWNELKKIIKDF
ncbi:MAG: SIR2 family protein [Actinobacteria bacterium]|nr:SIR2 family protein [Cyanobacteriota bacterium]MCL6087225.1 SIR2 family protein [Actinomycetota bacterium]